MNPSNHSSASEVDLKIKRRGSVTPAYAELTDKTGNLSASQQQIAEDLAHLRDREENLRAYEVRLRALQVEIESSRDQTRVVSRGITSSPFLAPSSRTPFDDGSLQAAWEKLHRARSLLEAEQTHVREDRLALVDEKASLKRREEQLAFREARFAAAQKVTVDAAAAAQEIEDNAGPMSRLTRAPMAIAKSVFSAKR
jgi:hypothetical protein